jgi:hypothetical protein
MDAALTDGELALSEASETQSRLDMLVRSCKTGMRDQILTHRSAGFDAYRESSLGQC